MKVLFEGVNQGISLMSRIGRGKTEMTGERPANPKSSFHRGNDRQLDLPRIERQKLALRELWTEYCQDKKTQSRISQNIWMYYGRKVCARYNVFQVRFKSVIRKVNVLSSELPLPRKEERKKKNTDSVCIEMMMGNRLNRNSDSTKKKIKVGEISKKRHQL